ncbi:hypothetical protein AVEN_12934-1 [Araneus ventricosus]|uniref:Uncharacterized protein n=1 Tax=Araneus ventricosus TaxID=182803 RepID=A0A4Y2SLK5_ARAVE|nr:hypothetical protein AVEN_12934-1 [Araneus ventricosus]
MAVLLHWKNLLQSQESEWDADVTPPLCIRRGCGRIYDMSEDLEDSPASPHHSSKPPKEGDKYKTDFVLENFIWSLPTM